MARTAVERDQADALEQSGVDANLGYFDRAKFDPCLIGRNVSRRADGFG